MVKPVGLMVIVASCLSIGAGFAALFWHTR
jgi:hypothetical protein